MSLTCLSPDLTVSEDAAGVLAAQGIVVHLFAEMAATPLGAFAVKHLGAAAGIVVTASHNPPEYNGYKVYQLGGNQINDPVDSQIASAIEAVAGNSKTASPECMPLQEAESKGLVRKLGPELFQEYKRQLLDSLVVRDAALAKAREALVIAYTPMHGVGAPYAEACLKEAGFPQVHTVKEQREADGDFPTVNFPNPEEKGAMDLVIALADKVGAHIAVANDPDADRLAGCARTRDGTMKQLTGDQLGSLLGDHLLRQQSSSSSAGKSRWALSTVVSSRLLAKLAIAYGAQHQETLTGFKWLGAVAKEIKERGDEFVFAYEEALGYMVSPMVWDKDGLTAITVLSNLAAELNAEGKSLWDRVEEIHRKAGASITMPRTIKLSPGSKGSDLMVKLRANLPNKIEQHDVILVSDLIHNPKKPSDPRQIPQNDVLRLYFADEAHDASANEPDILLSAPRIIVRPSGTEPKVKIYCESLGKLRDGEAYEAGMQRLESELEALVDAFFKYVTSL